MTIPTPTASDFRTQFPEFTEQDYPDDVITRHLTRAGYIHSVTQQGWLLLTAHLLSIAKADGALEATPAEPDGGQGLITEDKLGDKTKRFTHGGGKKGMADAKEFYKRTSYGRLFLEISRRSKATRIGVRIY